MHLGSYLQITAMGLCGFKKQKGSGFSEELTSCIIIIFSLDKPG